ncbi:MAG TPA: hypothetical protein VG604_00800 [Candidatus Saccharimonadales bacterium]|nr:hypothetical protein [Candidatus Saccharimonadales bacterium]
MFSTEFVKPYSPPKAPPAPGVPSDVPGWSNQFGHLLHDMMTGDDGVDLDLVAYQQWGKTEFDPIWRDELLRVVQQGQRFEPTQHERFHILNLGMVGEWAGHAYTTEGQDRHYRITSMQSALGITALAISSLQERHFRQSADQPHKVELEERSKMVGILNEFDTALALLEVQRRNPEVTFVLPAPPAFEAAKDDQHNADFIVASDEHVFGVQVKSSNSRKAIGKYDPSRIVIVDTDIDFDNVRIDKRSSDKPRHRPEILSWGGTLCADYVARMRGPNHPALMEMEVDPGLALRMKFVAKQLLVGSKPNLNRIVTRLEDRILPRLRGEYHAVEIPGVRIPTPAEYAASLAAIRTEAKEA